MRSIALVGTISAILFIAMASYCSPLHPSVPALQFTYTEFAFRAVTQAWGDAGVVRFKRHFLLDFPFLVSYGAWGYLLVTRSNLFRRYSPRFRAILAACLPAAAVADASENLLHFHLVSGSESHAAALYFVAGVVATFKWLLDGCFAILIVRSACQFFRKSQVMKYLLPPPVVAMALGGGMWLTARFLPVWHMTSPLFTPAAVALGAAAIVIFFAAAIQFLCNRTTINPIMPDRASALITGGVYRFSRNPIYIADFLLLSAYATWLGHPLTLAFPVLFVWIMNRWQIPAEEQALRKLFGVRYLRYCESVQRWV